MMMMVLEQCSSNPKCWTFKENAKKGMVWWMMMVVSKTNSCVLHIHVRYTLMIIMLFCAVLLYGKNLLRFLGFLLYSSYLCTVSACILPRATEESWFCSGITCWLYSSFGFLAIHTGTLRCGRLEFWGRSCKCNKGKKWWTKKVYALTC